jgi:hypothetical protein
MLFGKEKLFQDVHGFFVELRVLFESVSECGACKLGQDVVIDLYGARDEQARGIFPVYHVPSPMNL